jgi:autotransporter-associated beta strand protein
VNDLGNPWISGAITFAPGAPAYRLRGNPIRITDTLRNESGARQRIDLGVIIRMDYPENGVGDNRPPTIDTGPSGIALNGPLSSYSPNRDHNPDRLTKVGSGELVLSNNDNTFRGRDVFIYEGTLRIAGSRVAPNVVRNIQMSEGTALRFGIDTDL